MINQKSQEKIQLITELAKKLQIEMTAEQRITPEGFIKNVVYFIDTERYPVEEPIKENDENTIVREEEAIN